MSPLGLTGVVQMTNMLQSIIKGQTQVWIGMENDISKCVLTTSVVGDANLGIRNLEIFTMAFTEDLSSKMWHEGLRVIRKFAEANKCEKILMHTKNEALIRVGDRFGANTDYRLIVLEVNNG